MRISLVTPLRDEISNLPSIFSAMSSLDLQIHHWVICENGSTDGSREYLASAAKPDNITNLTVLNLDTETQEYQLGFKYSRIVLAGMNHIASSSHPTSDFVGILDADCFPSPNYYTRLLEEFGRRPKLGILSGTLFDEEGKRLPGAPGFPRGNSRLWRSACLDDAPYIVGMSADALSAIRAQAKGWLCDAISDAKVTTREVGQRAGGAYYGASAHYRGETLVFTTLKCLSKLPTKPKFSLDYFKGFLSAYIARAPQVNDREILEFSRGKIFRIIKKKSPQY